MAKRIVPLRKGSTAGKEEKIEVKVEPTLKEVTSELIGSQRKLGIQKGCVINMGNYESFRVTIWQERYCADDKISSNKVLAEMSDEIDELLEAEIAQVAEKK